MSKSKYGEFKMTTEEMQLWFNWAVADGLATHYKKMAQEHQERFERAKIRFWTHVRATRDMPKKIAAVSVSADCQHVIIHKNRPKDTQDLPREDD